MDSADHDDNGHFNGFRRQRLLADAGDDIDRLYGDLPRQHRPSSRLAAKTASANNATRDDE